MIAIVTALMDRLSRKPVKQMPDEDANIITQFALGDETLRDQAIGAHHRNLLELGVRGNLLMRFMAEIDTPCPDLNLRHQYRTQILKSVERAAA